MIGADTRIRVYMYACVHTPGNWKPKWFQHCTHPSLQSPQSSKASSPASLWWNTADKEEVRSEYVKWIKIHKILLARKKRNQLQRKLILVHHRDFMGHIHINVSRGLTTHMLNHTVMQHTRMLSMVTSSPCWLWQLWTGLCLQTWRCFGLSGVIRLNCWSRVSGSSTPRCVCPQSPRVEPSVVEDSLLSHMSPNKSGILKEVLIRV